MATVLTAEQRQKWQKATLTRVGFGCGVFHMGVGCSLAKDTLCSPKRTTPKFH